MRPLFFPTRHHDVDLLLCNVRPESLEDVWCMFDRPVSREETRMHLYRSVIGHSRCAYYRDRLMMIYGCEPLHGLLGDDAMVWALSTTAMDDHPVTAFRHHREWVAGRNKLYARLHSYVRMEYDVSLRWHGKLGFREAGTACFGPRDQEFVHFVREA